MSTPDLNQPVSVGKAAEYLGVSVATIQRWTNSGQLRSFRTPGNQRRIPLSELERLSKMDAGDE